MLRQRRRYPPSVWTPPAIPPADGATAGIPGTWLPDGARPPATVADLAAGVPVDVEADPSDPWTVGQYVQTGTTGVAGRAHYDGAAWVTGAAP